MDDISYKNLIGKHVKVQVDLRVTTDKQVDLQTTDKLH